MTLVDFYDQNKKRLVEFWLFDKYEYGFGECVCLVSIHSFLGLDKEVNHDTDTLNLSKVR